MADFRTSKYAVYSLILPPVLFAVLLPLLLTLPLNQALDPTPHSLQLGALSPVTSGPAATVLEHAAVEGFTVSDSKLNGSFIANASILRSFVSNSILRNVTLVDSVVSGSNIEGSVILRNTTLIDTVLVDTESPDAVFLAQFLASYVLMFLMIIPAMEPTVLASYSFVGEKVNRSLEPLLATPTEDGELLAGKSIAILAPTVAVTWAGSLLFLAVMNVLGGRVLARHPLPFEVWGTALLLLGPAIAVLATLANVFVSSRVSDVRAAQQIGSFLVLPVVLVFVGPAAGAYVLGPIAILGMFVVIVGVDVALWFFCKRLFSREAILLRWK